MHRSKSLVRVIKLYACTTTIRIGLSVFASLPATAHYQAHIYHNNPQGEKEKQRQKRSVSILVVVKKNKIYCLID